MAFPFIAALAKAAAAAEKVESTAKIVGPHSDAPAWNDKLSTPRMSEISSSEGHHLTDAAFHARVDGAAHSANHFFNLPDITVQEGHDICVYRDGGSTFGDIFEYNPEQFKSMGCTSFEDMTKVWSHECGHRILRTDFPNDPWTQELGADFFAGVRSEMMGLPTSNFESFLGGTKASLSHPLGSLRIKAIQYGREVVRNMNAAGIQPTVENCKAAFSNSEFTNLFKLPGKEGKAAAFVDDKSYHYGNAEKAQHNADYYNNLSKKASDNGDFAKAKDYAQKAESYEHKVKEEKEAGDKSSKLVDTPESVEETVEVKRLSFEEQTIDNDTLEEWRKKPENQGKIKEGAGHSSDVLRDNLSEVTGTNPEGSAAHHIVGNETPEAAKKLDEYGIDRNDPANGIFLPTSGDSPCKGSQHLGRHIRDYYNEVEQRFQNVSSREEALEVLQSLKEDLYNGDLPLHRDTEPNK